ncbi:MAG: helix-turn-helix domain-containing protein [Acidobacteriota bacterium]|nr:helix-turn-helix domain-containing protein [Acidobacteriota bacterium]
MARKFAELTANFSPERKARIAKESEELIQSISLHQLRKELRETQADVARRMRGGQGTVSKIEQRGSITIGNLDSYVRALGGTLEIRARVKGKTVELVVCAE